MNHCHSDVSILFFFFMDYANKAKNFNLYLSSDKVFSQNS